MGEDVVHPVRTDVSRYASNYCFFFIESKGRILVLVCFSHLVAKKHRNITKPPGDR